MKPKEQIVIEKLFKFIAETSERNTGEDTTDKLAKLYCDMILQYGEFLCKIHEVDIEQPLPWKSEIPFMHTDEIKQQLENLTIKK